MPFNFFRSFYLIMVRRATIVFIISKFKCNNMGYSMSFGMPHSFEVINDGLVMLQFPLNQMSISSVVIFVNMNPKFGRPSQFSS